MSWKPHPLQGVRVTAAAAAEVGAPIANEEAWTALLGDRADAVRAEHDWEVDHPETAWGVRTRHWSEHDVVHLAHDAARRLDTSRVDVVVLATSTPSRVSRSDAHQLAERLGVDAAAWDVKAGGAGGLLALFQGAMAVAQGARAALVVAAESARPYLSAEAPAVGMLYGDGAAALLVEPGRGEMQFASGHASVPGRPFTIAGSLPPQPGARFVATSPDRAYQDGLAGVWGTAAGVLRSFGSFDALAPYAVTRRQLERLSDQVPHGSLHHTLRDHGCTGCAGALMSIAAAHGAASTGSIAVGGGVSWAAWVAR